MSTNMDSKTHLIDAINAEIDTWEQVPKYLHGAMKRKLANAIQSYVDSVITSISAEREEKEKLTTILRDLVTAINWKQANLIHYNKDTLDFADRKIWEAIDNAQKLLNI